MYGKAVMKFTNENMLKTFLQDKRVFAETAHSLGFTMYQETGYNSFPNVIMFLLDDFSVELQPVKNIADVSSVTSAIKAMPVIEQKVKAIVLHADSYASKEQKAIELRKEYSLQEIFEGKAGRENMGMIKEMFATYVISASNFYMLSTEYKYTPVDGFEIGKTIGIATEDGTQIEGRIVDILSALQEVIS